MAVGPFQATVVYKIFPLEYLYIGWNYDTLTDRYAFKDVYHSNW